MAAHHGGHTAKISRAGVTLIEMIIIVTVLGILVLIGLPQLNSSLDNARLAGAADEVTVALQFAQATSASTGQPCKVTVDAGAGSILVEQTQLGGGLTGDALEIPAATVETQTYVTAPHPLRPGGLYHVVFSQDSRFNGVRIVSAVFGAGNTVVFDSLGNPSSAGAVVLTCGGQRIILNLDASSGRVTST
jgi:Tfp pilus assembly protein FimT